MKRLRLPAFWVAAIALVGCVEVQWNSAQGKTTAAPTRPEDPAQKGRLDPGPEAAPAAKQLPPPPPFASFEENARSVAAAEERERFQRAQAADAHRADCSSDADSRRQKTAVLDRQVAEHAQLVAGLKRFCKAEKRTMRPLAGQDREYVDVYSDGSLRRGSAGPSDVTFTEWICSPSTPADVRKFAGQVRHDRATSSAEEALRQRNAGCRDVDGDADAGAAANGPTDAITR